MNANHDCANNSTPFIEHNPNPVEKEKHPENELKNCSSGFDFVNVIVHSFPIAADVPRPDQKETVNRQRNDQFDDNFDGENRNAQNPRIINRRLIGPNAVQKNAWSQEKKQRNRMGPSVLANPEITRRTQFY